MTQIVARDRQQKMVLLGGLGIFGVGTMWTPEGDWHHTLPIWAEGSTPTKGRIDPHLAWDTAPERHYTP